MFILHFIYTLCLGVEISTHQAQDDDISMDADFFKNVTRTKASKHLKFGNGSFARGRGSRDRVKRRDEDEALRQARDGSVENIRAIMKNLNRKSLFNKTRGFWNRQGNSLYNEAGRKELIMFEAKYKASLKNVRGSKDVPDDADERNHEALVDADEYDDGMDLRADVVEELDDAGIDGRERAASTIPRAIDTWDSSHVDHVEDEKQDVVEEADNDASDLYSEETPTDPQNSSVLHNSKRASSVEVRPARRLIPEKRRPGAKKKPKNQKPLGNCYLIVDSLSICVLLPLMVNGTRCLPHDNSEFDCTGCGATRKSKVCKFFVAIYRKGTEAAWPGELGT